MKPFLSLLLAWCLIACTLDAEQSERLAKGLTAAFDIATMASEKYRQSANPDPAALSTLSEAETRARRAVAEAHDEIRQAKTAEARDAALERGIAAIKQYEAAVWTSRIPRTPLLHAWIDAQDVR